MERRDFVINSALAAGAVAAAATLGSRLASATETAFENPFEVQDAQLLKQLAMVRDSTTECLKKGLVCNTHCQDQLSAGNTSFARCSASVQQMNVLCRATSELATLKSVHVTEVIDSCISAMQSCRDACLEHKKHFAMGMHVECKECAESCDHCLAHCTELKKLSASA